MLPASKVRQESQETAFQVLTCKQTCGRPRAVSWVFKVAALSLLANEFAALSLSVATFAETCNRKVGRLNIDKSS